jgi:hypothetical protein
LKYFFLKNVHFRNISTSHQKSFIFTTFSENNLWNLIYKILDVALVLKLAKFSNWILIIILIIEENASGVCHPHRLQGRQDYKHVGEAEEPSSDQKEG